VNHVCRVDNKRLIIDNLGTKLKWTARETGSLPNKTPVPVDKEDVPANQDSQERKVVSSSFLNGAGVFRQTN